jgi:hypothetical protein
VKKKDLTQMNANVTQMNANSAEQWAAQVRTSQVLNNPANLQPRCAKIDQKTKVHASGSQIVNTLRAMRAVQRLNRLQFDQDSTFNEQICKIFADHGALVAAVIPRCCSTEIPAVCNSNAKAFS